MKRRANGVSSAALLLWGKHLHWKCVNFESFSLYCSIWILQYYEAVGWNMLHNINVQHIGGKRGWLAILSWISPEHLRPSMWTYWVRRWTSIFDALLSCQVISMRHSKSNLVLCHMTVLCASVHPNHLRASYYTTVTHLQIVGLTLICELHYYFRQRCLPTIYLCS